MEIAGRDQSGTIADGIEASAGSSGDGSETLPLVLYGEAASISHALVPGDRLLVYCPVVRSEHLHSGYVGSPPLETQIGPCP